MLLRHWSMPGSDLARHVNFSSHTFSVIFRKLEKDGLLERGEPIKGKVGKPSVPMTLAKNGVFSLGLRIGRRSSELVLIDLHGKVHNQLQIKYNYPMPDIIFSFLENGISKISLVLKQKDKHRICGIGVAAPFELWNWHELVGAPQSEFSIWKTIDFSERIAMFSELPVYPVNDATAACRAEHVYGRGREFQDYAYFFVATFVGGGIVINHSVFEGHRFNAGALGSLRSIGPNGETRQLIDMASVHLLEKRLVEVDIDPKRLWEEPQDWSEFSRYVDPWLRQTAQELAKACLSTCSVIDFEAILIDGAFPLEVKTALVELTRRYLATQDTRGLIPPTIEQAVMGGDARTIGAASGPIFSQLFLNANAGFKES
jgi:predicted NBD/HSP70 family sugar kinase